MTLGEAKEKALKLMDEYSVNGVLVNDEDIKSKMVPFFDTAQKNLCQVKKIPREYRVPVETGAAEYPMPGDFLSLRRVWVDGQPGSPGRWLGSTLLLPAGEGRDIRVEYNAWPADIPPDAPDSYAFEIAPDAQECLPYWVASQVMLTDFVVDYQPLLNLYDRMVSMLSTAQPGSIVIVKAGEGR